MNILNRRNRGFTLIEILIVLVILAGIVAMLTRGTMGGRNAALVNQTKVDMNGRIRTAVISRVSLLGQMPADIALDFTESNLLLGTDGLNDPFGDQYSFEINGTNPKEVVIKPKAGGKAATMNVPSVVVDCAPYIP
ncbi:MAG: type II secretion system GspH family protein [Puniceicoccales bacterium]|jgi:prepilin-type N-terminal cleavage/methylation domain-containing protein|nr:type II secretion system GspH family protein [Puniceicoccales bacterium]